MISLASIPESLKNDRLVAPFIARLVELSEVNPVVSYYCKLYVLEHILTHKLHQTGKDVETFTIALLDDTEHAKQSSDDESVRHVLGSKQLSLDFLFVFAFKLFHGCLEDLGAYDGLRKAQLAQKLRVTINFWSLFPLFTSDPGAEPLDYAKTTGGQANTEQEFLAFTKEKLKTLKFQLSRLLKDEVPIKGEEQELAALETSISISETGNNEGDVETGENAEKNVHDSVSSGPETENGVESPESSGFALPQAPKLNPEVNSESEQEEENPFTLPGAPKFDPGEKSDSESSAINLPGAPKLLPDDDLSQVNKKSSIQVFPPEKGVNEETRPKPTPQRTPSSTVTHVTKESLHSIVDTTEQVGKIQKHAKFAISALNYEDWATAEAELVKGLEMLRRIKEKA